MAIFSSYCEQSTPTKLGRRPDPQEVLPYTWTRGSWKQETIELKGLPFYQNYRILSAALLVLIELFIIVFW